MGGRSIRGMCMPKHLPATGRGWREDDASGFVREAHDYVHDVRQGMTAPEFADLTPGFGTHHPQDVKQLGILDDPRPIEDARPLTRCNETKQDLSISDYEIELSIKQGRPPRPGY